jgi:hypothetical protein
MHKICVPKYPKLIIFTDDMINLIFVIKIGLFISSQTSMKDIQAPLSIDSENPALTHTITYAILLVFLLRALAFPGSNPDIRL